MNDKKEDKKEEVKTSPANAKDEVKKEEAKKPSRLIKYMGSSDIRIIGRDEDAMGTLPPMPHPVRWKRSNNWMLDASKFPDVPEEWWDHMIGSGEFRDVTDDKVKPLNAHQTTFLGMGGNSAYNADLDALSSAPGTAPEANAGATA